MKNILFILGQLTDQDAEWLSRAGATQELRRGARLIEQGLAIESVYIVLEGRFAVSRRGGPVINRVGPGEMIGEMSFVDASRPSADVVAEDDSVVLALPRQALQERLEGDAAFAARFYRAISMMLSDRLRSADKGLAAMPAQEGVLEPDELDPNVLETVGRAGERFDRMLKTLRGR